MKFLKDSIIIRLSPIKHLAYSDPSKKLKKIIPYEQNKKRKAKDKETISEELSNSNLVVNKTKEKKKEGNVKKRHIKNEDLGFCNKDTYILNSETKKKDDIESEENRSFSLEERDTKDIEYVYISNSTSPLLKTINIQDEFIWDIENNISYNISSDNYSVISSNLDYYSD
ncbi:hypothetical protein T552_00846 [Pneumocystis carinii B80]|uniref:Uncharacterized protein n=1 Tax=Pneumocystis carinii (strain B80) TaxID=1408658 RepID=A0A0W4ZPQ7_PNEC8|nr:hypothetical protein T552_00846 [Pneumocystis carinii B80]KTW30373.1 hypothetical protein T552_00846 [Pneumocystis carinii B80]